MRKKLTGEQLKNNEIRKLSTRIKNACSEIGMNAIKNQLAFLKENNTKLPNPLLNKEETVEAIEDGISRYVETYCD